MAGLVFFSIRKKKLYKIEIYISYKNNNIVFAIKIQDCIRFGEYMYKKYNDDINYTKLVNYQSCIYMMLDKLFIDF